MLYGLLLTGYIFVCFLLVVLILVQKGKGSAGFGAIGGGSQVLFGGSGGQDVFQKTTWILGSIFMFGSLGLAIMKTSQSRMFKYAKSLDKLQLPMATVPPIEEQQPVSEKQSS